MSVFVTPLIWRGQIIALEGQSFQPIKGLRHSEVTEPGYYWIGSWKRPSGGEFRLVRLDRFGRLTWVNATAESVDQYLGRVCFPRCIISISDLPTRSMQKNAEEWETALLKAGRFPQLAPLLALEGRKVDWNV